MKSNRFYLIITRGIMVLIMIPIMANDWYETDLENAEPQFKKHIITSNFISEGVAVGDVNKDGKLDIMAGPYWFEAPDFIMHEIDSGKSYDPATEYSTSFLNFSLDVNLDGWIDLIVIGFPGEPAFWYENPKNNQGYWKKHPVNDAVGVGNESPNFVDVDGDERKDIVSADTKAKQMVWLRAPTTPSSLIWERFTISEDDAPGTDRFSHGIGFGDINKDGKKDVLIKDGWWEAPEDPRQPGWKFHKANLGEDCSHMHVIDVNSDGLNDVVSASAHKYGIWWHEQKKDDKGNISWIKHTIHDKLSQTHSSALVDINDDGKPDLITGKRFFAHNDTDIDPGTHEPALLLWFEFMPGKQPYWKKHEVDNDSGSGLNMVVQDMNNDGIPDIVVSNKKGVFYFERQK